MDSWPGKSDENRGCSNPLPEGAKKLAQGNPEFAAANEGAALGKRLDRDE
jgi:hypothetical protein